MKTKRIFSNGTECDNWLEKHCGNCVFGNDYEDKPPVYNFKASGD